MPRGKKQLSEQIIPKLRVLRTTCGEVRLCTESSRCGHDASRIAWAKLMGQVGEEFPLE